MAATTRAKRPKTADSNPSHNGIPAEPLRLPADRPVPEVSEEHWGDRFPGHEEAYRLLFLGRTLDEEAVQYLKRNMGWSYHAPCAGHDAIQLALGCTFRAKVDHLFPYYRDMLTCLAGGMSAEEIILNGLSRAADPAGAGRHMSNHFAKPAIHIHNVSSCVSNHAQHAAGLALAIKKYAAPHKGADATLVKRAKAGPVVYCSFGESSTSEGYVYEAFNAANLHKLPVIFVMQDNAYGIGVPKREQSANFYTYENFLGFRNVRFEFCDGRSVSDCFRAMNAAREHVEAGLGPACVYAECRRIHSHSNSDAHEQYRSEAELEEAKAWDPLPLYRSWLLESGTLTEKKLKEIEADATSEFKLAKEAGESAPIADIATVEDNLYPPTYPASENPEGLPVEGLDGPVLKLREGINQALREYFRENPDTFMWGQDMANGKKEGIFKVTDAMQAEFGPSRVFNAPIAENYITGAADGFSRFDPKIRVVVEGAEFADYPWPAMDQIVELSHEYWRTNGQFSPNVIVRVASGGGIGGGLYHSQNIEWALVSLPGLRVVQPAFADDAAGLMRTALLSQGCTIYLEPKQLYNMPSAKSKVASGFVVPFGKGRIRRSGKDVSVITYGAGVHHALAAAKLAEQEGLSLEVFDIRSLVPLDVEGICASVRKTSRAIVLHEDKVFGGFGGELASIISSQCFGDLDAPVERIGQKYIPVPFNKVLEAAMQPTPEIVLEAAKRLAAW